jgi:UDP-GlcNAc:undecaprenyl-phosphate/decaprenyl-phosphate GlcNAc-1-phosphate transferase
MILVLSVCAAGVVAFLISAAIMPLVISLSHKRSWYDIPNERKIHTNPIPRLGGMGIFCGFLAASVGVPLLTAAFFPASHPASFGLNYLPLFLAFILIHVTGLVDDFHNLHAWVKLLLQILAASFVTVGGFTISFFWVPGLGSMPLGVFAYPVTILWIVAISNAMNLVDGVDGLAGGITAISAVFIGIMCLIQGSPVPCLIAFALVGAALGFLRSNLPPARIFMGDSGSLLIGFVLATLPLLVSPGQTSVVDCIAPATALLIPILDTLSAIVRRLKERRPIHSADKEHVHHKLLDIGLSNPQLLLVMYGACIFFGLAAMGSLYLDLWSGLGLLGAVWLVALAALAFLSSIRQKKLAASGEEHLT